jgi:hypothetical protein
MFIVILMQWQLVLVQPESMASHNGGVPRQHVKKLLEY